MNKICLVYSCNYNEFTGTENLGIMYLTAVMQQESWEVMNINIFDDSAIENILTFTPDVTGISVMSENTCEMMSFAADLSKVLPYSHFVVGGPGVTAEPENYIEDFEFIEAAVVGEGEITLPEIAKALMLNQPKKEVKGICYRDDNNHAVRTQPRQLIMNLDELPVLEHDDFKAESADGFLRHMTLMSSRGCGGRCSFCYKTYDQQPGKKIRFQTPERFVDEITYLSKKFNFHRFQIIDQTFEDYGEFGKSRIREIANRIIDAHLNLIITIHIRTENWSSKDQDLIDLMKKAGFISIYPGLEAGTERGLRLYNKIANLADHKRTIQLFNQNEFLIDYGFINIHPYTKIDELFDNCSFLEEAGVGFYAHVLYNRLMVYPNTPIEKKLLMDNLLLYGNVSYRNINNSPQYRCQDDNMQKIYNLFYIEKVIKENIEFVQKLYTLAKDFMFWTSLCSNKLEQYPQVEKYVKELIELKNEVFLLLTKTNIGRFHEYVQLGLEGWNTQVKDKIEKKYNYKYLDDYVGNFGNTKMHLIHSLKKNNINDLNNILNLV